MQTPSLADLIIPTQSKRGQHEKPLRAENSVDFTDAFALGQTAPRSNGVTFISDGDRRTIPPATVSGQIVDQSADIRSKVDASGGPADVAEPAFQLQNHALSPVDASVFDDGPIIPAVPVAIATRADDAAGRPTFNRAQPIEVSKAIIEDSGDDPVLKSADRSATIGVDFDTRNFRNHADPAENLPAILSGDGNGPPLFAGRETTAVDSDGELISAKIDTPRPNPPAAEMPVDPRALILEPPNLTFSRLSLGGAVGAAFEPMQSVAAAPDESTPPVSIGAVKASVLPTAEIARPTDAIPTVDTHAANATVPNRHDFSADKAPQFAQPVRTQPTTEISGVVADNRGNPPNDTEAIAAPRQAVAPRVEVGRKTPDQPKTQPPSIAAQHPTAAAMPNREVAAERTAPTPINTPLARPIKTKVLGSFPDTAESAPAQSALPDPLASRPRERLSWPASAPLSPEANVTRRSEPALNWSDNQVKIPGDHKSLKQSVQNTPASIPATDLPVSTNSILAEPLVESAPVRVGIADNYPAPQRTPTTRPGLPVGMPVPHSQSITPAASMGISVEQTKPLESSTLTPISVTAPHDAPQPRWVASMAQPRAQTSASQAPTSNGTIQPPVQTSPPQVPVTISATPSPLQTSPSQAAIASTPIGGTEPIRDDRPERSLEIGAPASTDATHREANRAPADIRMSRQIAHQLADVARHLPDRPVELTLNPEELGRVRMTLSAADSTIAVSLVAERGETAELLRRNIAVLAEEFRALGYRDISFSLNDGRAGQQGGADRAPTINTAGDTPEPDPGAPPPIRVALGSGVDIRL